MAFMLHSKFNSEKTFVTYSAITYTATPLTPLALTKFIVVNGMNDAGDVVGSISDQFESPNHAFIWNRQDGLKLLPDGQGFAQARRHR